MNVVIAGGGVAALEALLALRVLAGERVKATLVSPEPDFVYRPMLIAEPFDAGRLYRFDLARVAADQGAGLKEGRVLSVDEDRRVATTWNGEEIGFDALLAAPGARQVEWLPGAFTFGLGDRERMRSLLAGLETGLESAAAFVVPAETGWVLPVYELALMTASRLEAEANREVELTLVTPEGAPLELFGDAASQAVAELLDRRGVRLVTGARATEVAEGEVRLDSGPGVRAGFAVTLPRIEGPQLGGLPAGAAGFIPVDEWCRVAGAQDVWAAGDATDFPVKQGGIAAQQADTAAAQIAIRAGADVEAIEFRPVLRGLLLTGGVPEYLRGALAKGGAAESLASSEPLWWPPGKIAGRFLTPYLANLAEGALPDTEPEVDGSIRIEVPLY